MKEEEEEEEKEVREVEEKLKGEPEEGLKEVKKGLERGEKEEWLKGRWYRLQRGVEERRALCKVSLRLCFNEPRLPPLRSHWRHLKGRCGTVLK